MTYIKIFFFKNIYSIEIEKYSSLNKIFLIHTSF